MLVECTTEHAAQSSFSENEDDEELFKGLFRTLDANDDGFISQEEIKAALNRFSSRDEMKELLEHKSWSEAYVESIGHSPKQGIDFEEFSKLLKKLPRVGSSSRLHTPRTRGTRTRCSQSGACPARRGQHTSISTHARTWARTHTNALTHPPTHPPTPTHPHTQTPAFARPPTHPPDNPLSLGVGVCWCVRAPHSPMR